MRFFAFIAVMALTFTTLVTAVRIKDCGSTGEINYSKIQITGCSATKPYCIFQKNTTAHLTIPFVPKTEVTSLKAVVHGIIAGIPLPFPLDDPQACGEVFDCPLEPQQSVEYKEGLPVKTIYPSLRLKVKWALVDQDGNNQVCIIIPVKLQS